MNEGRSKPFRLSLQAKVVVLILLCVLIPLLLSGAYLYRRSEEMLGEKVRLGLQGELLRKASDLDDWVAQRLRQAADWAASFVVYEGLESLSREGDGTRARGELKQYLLSVLDLGRYREYESLFLVDLRGDVVASTREERLDPWAENLIKSGQANTGILSPLLWGGSDRPRPTLLVLEPVLGRVGLKVGYLVERLDLMELGSLLSSQPTVDGSVQRSGPVADAASFWLLDAQGQVVIAGGKIVTQPAEMKFPGTTLPENAVAGPVLEAFFPGGGSTLYSERRLSHSGIVVATVPSRVAFRPLEESAGRLRTMGLLAIATSLLVSYLVARSLLKPILLLSEGARRVAAGDLLVFLPVWGRDEIADLTGAFNEMARKLREGRLNLEETRDQLARTNDELGRTNEDLKAANRTLETLAITDGLTGLYNHRHFQETLEKEMRRCDRESKDLSLLLLDLDHFKQYNDRFGHTEGDAALRRVAGIVTKTIRSSDVAFRYGGEELAVLLPSCPKGQAADVAEKIRDAVNKFATRPGRFGGRLTVSIGVGTFPEDGRVARGLVDYADAALYAAKANGRDQVSITGSGAHSTSTG